MSSRPHAFDIEGIFQKDLHREITSRLAKLIAKAKPGTRLPSERELSERLNVGRNSVSIAILDIYSDDAEDIFASLLLQNKRPQTRDVNVS